MSNILFNLFLSNFLSSSKSLAAITRTDSFGDRTDLVGVARNGFASEIDFDLQLSGEFNLVDSISGLSDFKGEMTEDFTL